MLEPHEKHLISLIDEQAKTLLAKGVLDATLLNTLFEFVPEVRCLIEANDKDELKMYLSEYQYFSYFITLFTDMD